MSAASRVLSALSLCWIVASLAIFAWRASYPLELEWLEGGMLVHALRIGQGSGIYVEPSREFVPFLYTPLYPWLLAQLGRVFGVSFLLGRAISLASVLVICGLAARAVRERSEAPELALFAAAAPLAAYVFTARWLDLARADSLMLAFYLAGLATLLRALRYDSVVRAIVAGVLVSLAFWTKQTAVVLILATGAAVLPMVVASRGWRTLSAYVGCVAFLCLGGLWLGQRMTHGWLWFYIYEGHQGHELNWVRLTRKTWWMHAHAAPFVVLVLALLLGHALTTWIATRRASAASRAVGEVDTSRLPQGLSGDGAARADRMVGVDGRHLLWFWATVAAAGLFVGALGYSTQWAESNAFIPGVTLSAIAIALWVQESEAIWLRSWATSLLGAQLLFSALLEPQAAALQKHGVSALLSSYRVAELSRTVPSVVAWRNAEQQRDSLASAARNSQGPLLALHRPWWSVLAGDPGADLRDGDQAWSGEVSAMGMNDVDANTRRTIQGQIQRDLSEERYAQVWSEGEPPAWMLAVLRGHYSLERRIIGAQRVSLLSGYMSDGGMSQPWESAQLVLTRVHDRQLPPGARVVADFEENDFSGFEVQGYSLGVTPAWSVHGDNSATLVGSDGVAQRQPPIPLVGPIGGARLLSTANVDGLAGLGSARSPVISLAEHEELVLLVGRGGQGAGVHVSVLDAQSLVELGRIELPREPWELKEVRVATPDETTTQEGVAPNSPSGVSQVSTTGPNELKRNRERRVRLEVIDEDKTAAVFLDDVWVVTHEESPPRAR